MSELTQSEQFLDEKNQNEEQLSHEEALQLFDVTLANVLESDPLLNDLPPNVTLDEVNSQIALEYGQAMTVNVIRGDGEVYPVIVEQKAAVLDLKKAIKRYVMLKLAREGNETKISWKYIWRTYWLYFEGQKLAEDNKKIKDYGIRNKAEVTFIKRLKEKK